MNRRAFLFAFSATLVLLLGCGGNSSDKAPAPASPTELAACQALPLSQRVINHTNGAATNDNLLSQWLAAQLAISTPPGVNLNAASSNPPKFYFNASASSVQPDCAVTSVEADVPVVNLEQQFPNWKNVCTDPGVNYVAHPDCLDPSGTFVLSGLPVHGFTQNDHSIDIAQSIVAHAGWIVNQSSKTKVLDTNSMGAAEYEFENVILERLGADVSHR